MNSRNPAPFGSAPSLAPFASTPTTPPPMPHTRRAARRGLSRIQARFFADRVRGGQGVVEVAQLWRGDLVRIDQVCAKFGASIGPDEATYLVEHEHVPTTTTFVKKDGGAWVCSVPTHAKATIIARSRGGRPVPYTVQQALTHGLAHQADHGVIVPMADGVGVSLELDELTFLVRLSTPSTAKWPLLAGVSVVGVALAVVLSLSFHGALGALVAFSTDRAEMYEIDRLNMPSRFGEALLVPMNEEEKQEPEAPEEDAGEPTQGSKAAGAEGKSGTADASNERGRFAVKGDQGDMRPSSRQVASSAGALAASDSMHTLLAMSMPAAGSDVMDAWGNFESSEAVGDVPGTYGLGMVGAGRSAGGDQAGGVWGTGEFGTVGKRNPGAAGGLSDGKAKLECETCGQTRPRLRPARPTVSGGLDKRIIRKVVNQHKRELKACYQKELQRTKGLHGKIDVKWIIDASGSVSKAVLMASSMKNDAVEQCVVASVSRWRFPAPKEGGMVAVSYPFVFEAAH